MVKSSFMIALFLFMKSAVRYSAEIRGFEALGGICWFLLWRSKVVADTRQWRESSFSSECPGKIIRDCTFFKSKNV